MLTWPCEVLCAAEVLSSVLCPGDPSCLGFLSLGGISVCLSLKQLLWPSGSRHPFVSCWNSSQPETLFFMGLFTCLWSVHCPSRKAQTCLRIPAQGCTQRLLKFVDGLNGARPREYLAFTVHFTLLPSLHPPSQPMKKTEGLRDETIRLRSSGDEMRGLNSGLPDPKPTQCPWDGGLRGVPQMSWG